MTKGRISHLVFAIYPKRPRGAPLAIGNLPGLAWRHFWMLYSGGTPARAWMNAMKRQGYHCIESRITRGRA